MTCLDSFGALIWNKRADRPFGNEVSSTCIPSWNENEPQAHIMGLIVDSWADSIGQDGIKDTIRCQIFISAEAIFEE